MIIYHGFLFRFFLNFLFHRIKIDLLNQEYTVFYVGTNLGRVYKIVQFYRNNEPNSKLLDIFEVAPEEPIQVMEISQTRKSLYVATDNRIKQIDLAMCNRRYDSCFRCVKDPYCGWDKDTNVCRPYELGLLQVNLFVIVFQETALTFLNAYLTLCRTQKKRKFHIPFYQ